MSGWSIAGIARGLRPGVKWLLRYQLPTRQSTAIAVIAMIENQAMLCWPKGTTMAAASSGPSDEPTLPPTWKTDCANPCRPPEASRAMREDSGWKIDEPRPISPAASSSSAKVGATDRSSRPTKLAPMPIGSANGCGRRSV